MNNTPREKLVNGSVSIGLSTLLNKGIQFFFLIYISTFKSQDQFALYIEFVLYTEILAIMLAHGANSSMLKGSLSENIQLNLNISIFFVTLLAVITSFLWPIISFKDLGELSIYILIGSPIIALNSIHKTALISEKRLSRYSKSLRYSNLVLLFFPIFDIFILPLDIFNALTFLILSQIASIFIMGYYPTDMYDALRVKNIKKYLVSSMPFLVRNNLGSLTKNMGLLNISYSASVSSLSGYGLINKIADQVGQALSLLTIQIVPELRDALQNSDKKNINQYVKVVLIVLLAFWLLSSLGCTLIFYGIAEINPQAWILEFKYEAYILSFALGLGFVKSNLASWEFLKSEHTGKIIIIVEIGLMIIAFFTYSTLYDSLDTVGIALSYALIQIINLIIHIVLFRFFRFRLSGAIK